MTDDRELTGDEAQRALSEAVRRIRGTVTKEPERAELIAFVREQQKYYQDVRSVFGSCSEHTVAVEYDDKIAMFSALLTVLEGPPQERLWQAFEAGHHAWPTPEAQTRRALFERWLSSSPASVATGAGADVRALAGLSEWMERFADDIERYDHCSALFMQEVTGLRQWSKQLSSIGKAAWEAGFKLAVGYGDNWIHFDGEQKERQWRAYLASSAGTAAPVPLPDAAPSPKE